MQKLLYLSFLFFFSALPLVAARDLTLDDFLSIRDVEDPQVSLDGKWIAYVVDSMDLKKDKSNKDIYMVAASGGEPIRLTNNDKNDSRPRWSPDNRYLAFLSARTKDKKQVYLLNRNGGEAIQLTEIKQGISDFSWSPDSKKLALVVGDPDPDEIDTDVAKAGDDKPKKPIVLTRMQFLFDEYGFLKELYSHIYTFDLETKALKQLTSGPYDDAAAPWSSFDSTPQWSPDGKWILFISNRTETPDTNRNTDLYIVSSSGGDIRKLTTNPGSDEDPHWSPDGKSIVYLTRTQPKLIWYDTTEVAVLAINGGSPKILTQELDRNAWSARFSPDGRNIYFLLEDRGTQRLASIPAGGGKITFLSQEKVINDYDFAANTTVVLASRYDLPYEIFAVEGAKDRQITRTNAKALKDVRLGAAERITYKSKDGTVIEAFVDKPPSFSSSKKYPLILWIHGGPTSQYMEDFNFLPHLYAAKGFVVLRPNPRGSTGYGEEFCKAIFADWGNKDYDDVIAGVDHLIALGYVDPKKLGVGGWSYGGMLTDHVITKTPRFAAAVSGASELNYLMNYGTDHYQHEWEMEIGLPWENPDAYTKISPFFELEKVKTPTLVLCGESDWNVPLINSEQLYQSLRRLGVDTMLIVYPGQPHSISIPSYQKDRFQRYLAWFGHYLQGDKKKVPA